VINSQETRDGAAIATTVAHVEAVKRIVLMLESVSITQVMAAAMGNLSI